MTNLKRKIERNHFLNEKKQLEKSMTSKLNMFDRLPDKCDTCHADFDKKSKEMAQTWTVVVKSAEKLVRLFCPKCMTKAKRIIEDASKKNENNVIQEDT